MLTIDTSTEKILEFIRMINSEARKMEIVTWHLVELLEQRAIQDHTCVEDEISSLRGNVWDIINGIDTYVYNAEDKYDQNGKAAEW